MAARIELPGRGPAAVADMKARIAALQAAGADVIDVLWERSREAELGEGYTYDLIETGAEPVRPVGQRRL